MSQTVGSASLLTDDSITMSFRSMAIAALGLVGGIGSVRADAVRVFAGHGQNADQFGLGIQFDRAKSLHEFDAAALTGHVEIDVAEFHGRKNTVLHNTVRAFAGVGKVRWQRRPDGSLTSFIEVGLGMGGLSQESINGDRNFGGHFQFTEILRYGIRWGSNKQFEVAIGGQHFSNAGLHAENSGITYVALSGAWYWR
jgi:hypothetical protein